MAVGESERMTDPMDMKKPNVAVHIIPQKRNDTDEFLCRGYEKIGGESAR
jgi:hypothetical protein